MKYKSTRNNVEEINSSEAILNGIAPDGGLYVPVEIPRIDLNSLLDLDYQGLAVEILKMYLTDFTDQEIKCCVYKAYDEKFEHDEIVPLKHLEDVSILELYHGRTLAFKDMALSILPHLMKKAAKKLNVEEEIVILTATSGDTGKAALEGFSEVEGTRIVVFYPDEGISDIQKQQMVTQEGKNTYVFGIKGNFDDAQTAVKKTFLDRALREKIGENGFRFSSANSINIGRLVPQIVYYIYGYLKMVKDEKISLGEEINVVVPTGNFGNILAAKYAKMMGLPINRLICASNENHILTDFIENGVYDLKRSFKVTNSPSMDILISSNLERYLDIIGEDVDAHMSNLKELKRYELSQTGKENMVDFSAGYSNERETLAEIKKVFTEEDYLFDTHTAVASSVYRKYRKQSLDVTKTMIISTASPYKFTRHVLDAISDEKLLDDDFELIEVLNKTTGVAIPSVIEGIADMAIRHPHVISKTAIKNTIETILR